jgi:hypothetical protein
MSYSPAAIVLKTIIDYGCYRLAPEIREAGIFLIVPVTSDACRTPIHFRRSRPVSARFAETGSIFRMRLLLAISD